jgi:UDP-N-acetylglucosamine 2-epimerase (non-hydrolysing)
MLIFGTRPEAVKLAPVALALAKEHGLDPVVTVTAQHRAMLDQVLDAFEIVPDFDLNIIQPRQSLAEVTARAVTGLDQVLADARPDLVLVQGDTTSTFVGALCGFYHRIPVLHLEAGLRTGKPYSPYPEEANRRLTAQLSTLHLAATKWAKRNLLAEGVPPEAVVVTGNTVVDALLWTLQRSPSAIPASLADLGTEPQQGPKVLLVTAHRRESWGTGMQSLGQALRDVATARPDVVVVVPLHLNPVVREAIIPEVTGVPNIRVVDPLSYPEFAVMMRRAHLILTDSGGIQEEAPTLGTPVLITRDTTERPEAVSSGSARLVGTDRARVAGHVLRLLQDQDAYRAMASAGNPFGDGAAAGRVVAAIRHVLFGTQRPADFEPTTGELNQHSGQIPKPSRTGLAFEQLRPPITPWPKGSFGTKKELAPWN